MAPLATPVDIERRWRALSDDELPRIEAAIEDASSLVRRRYPTIDARIAAGSPTAAEVAAVIARIVIRGEKNPDGFRQEATGAVSATYSERVSAGYLYLADEDIDILRVPKTYARAPIHMTPLMRPFDRSLTDDPNWAE